MTFATLDMHCKQLTPHDFSGDVLVIPETPNDKTAFIVLKLDVGSTKLCLYLPAYSYNAARSIADLWSTLVDRPVSPALSAQARDALRSVLRVSCVCSDCDGHDRDCAECGGTGRVAVVPLEAV